VSFRPSAASLSMLTLIGRTQAPVGACANASIASRQESSLSAFRVKSHPAKTFGDDPPNPRKSQLEQYYKGGSLNRIGLTHTLLDTSEKVSAGKRVGREVVDRLVASRP